MKKINYERRRKIALFIIVVFLLWGFYLQHKAHAAPVPQTKVINLSQNVIEVNGIDNKGTKVDTFSYKKNVFAVVFRSYDKKAGIAEMLTINKIFKALIVKNGDSIEKMNVISLLHVGNSKTVEMFYVQNLAPKNFDDKILFNKYIKFKSN